MFTDTTENPHVSRSWCWPNICSRFTGALLLALFTLIVTATSSKAQTYVEADIGYIPVGSYTYNGAATPPTYSVGGAGSGIGAGSDKLTFVRTTASGNTEIRARLSSESLATTTAYSGLMMRESDINQACGMATIGVTPGGVLTFQYRTQSGGTFNTVTGPAVTVPIYLRLVKNGDTISGYYSQSGKCQQL